MEAIQSHYMEPCYASNRVEELLREEMAPKQRRIERQRKRKSQGGDFDAVLERHGTEGLGVESQVAGGLALPAAG